MTSGVFTTVPIHSILVARMDRQRKELVNIDDLAESINRIGLINPIVISRDNNIVAGERRWTACKQLGWTHIPVQYTSELNEAELQVIELEENVKRVDLPWQDQVDALAKYQRLRKSMDPDWKQDQLATEIGMSSASVSRMLTVADAIDRGITRVAEADKFSTALGIANRENERRSTAALDRISLPSVQVNEETEEVEQVQTEPAKPIVPLINADFLEWSRTYIGPKFNLIHCDFPYGVGMDKSDQGSGGAFGTYADGLDVYEKLINGLAAAMSNVVADSAHLIFWYSMDYHQWTKEALEEMGWRVNPFPLIWMKSDNTGILPDPHRGPRRIYETAFFASRGDRKLATGPVQGPVANAFAFAGKGKIIHMNEKPVPMLTHFMKLCCDEYSSVLDPTAGSGNALKAAQDLGASTVLGIERDSEFYARSVDLYFNKENGND